jgi:hypothetical protein
MAGFTQPMRSAGEVWLVVTSSSTLQWNLSHGQSLAETLFALTASF